MQKVVKILIPIILVLSLIVGITFIVIKYDKHVREIEGMKVTLIGGSNLKEKENVNSMGYFIRTRNGKTIIIDGGREFDYDEIKYYIDKYSNGKVDYWILTHGHLDHVDAFLKLVKEDDSFVIENLYYSLLEDEWYEKYDKRGYESTHSVLEELDNDKILNHTNCEKNQVIEMDNIRCDIIRIARPEITIGDSGNEASMVFKLTATDVDKSMIFFGDAKLEVSKEILEKPELLKADAVQMAHHGQSGVSKEVYDAVNPKVCFFNCPEWLWNNDSGEGYDSGKWKTLIVRSWMEEKNTINYKSFEGDQTIHFCRDGLIKLNEN